MYLQLLWCDCKGPQYAITFNLMRFSFQLPTGCLVGRGTELQRWAWLSPIHCLNLFYFWWLCLSTTATQEVTLGKVSILILWEYDIVEKVMCLLLVMEINSNLRQRWCVGQKIKVLDNYKYIWNVKFSNDSNLHCEKIYKDTRGKNQFVDLFQQVHCSLDTR